MIQRCCRVVSPLQRHPIAENADPLKGVLCESTQIVNDRREHQFTLGYEMSTVSPQRKADLLEVK